MKTLASRFALHKLSVAVTLALALSACGGGSGGDDSPAAPVGGPEPTTPSNPVGSGSTPPEATPEEPGEVLQLAGVVRNYYTGEVIPSALIRLSASADQGFAAFSEATADAAGAFSINRPNSDTALLLDVTASGYARGVVTIPAGSAGLAVELIPQLQPVVAQVGGSTTAPLVVNYTRTTIDGETTAPVLNVPAASLVDAAGNLFEGDYSVGFTLIDPSSDPALMPGSFEAVDPATGTISQIESFGAIEIGISNPAGEALNFVGGSAPVLSIPLASTINPATAPASVPLFFFDTSLGYWVDRGVAQLTQLGESWAYQGAIDRTGIWNADIQFDAVTLTGCVADAEGQRLPNVRLMADGRTYIGRSRTLTDANGQFSVPVRPDSQLLVAAVLQAQSETVITDIGATDVNIADCLVLSPSAATARLTWGENPRDLDTYFFGPDGNGGEFEVSFMDKTVAVGTTQYDLDVDDVTSFGPEVLTLPEFQFPGIYRYVVDLYAGTGTMAASPTRVELNLKGDIRVFSATEAQGDASLEKWHVFNLVVDEALTVTMQPVQRFSDSDRADAFDVAGFGPASVKSEIKPEKYYAQPVSGAVPTRQLAD
ncbi:carboxypeptidase-like regulatory domain-containing protein [Allohahella marinimesophila]|uniref:Carboxypeptidase regulatory-like domain-containing protein n=1 Tax=Allohahella marinimesophila TaxID=1054972 RepID=A0ABP7NJL4_9GAMM